MATLISGIISSSIQTQIMISKARIKQIHSLRIKKYRDESGLFVGEGPKVVGEMLTAFPCAYLAATSEWIAAHKDLAANISRIDEVSQEELKKASLQDSPQQVIALFEKNKKIRTDNWISPQHLPKEELVLALDCIQDPGNMGTIIRLANWFGIRLIVCSSDTVDAFSPKVVQSTMGALTKVDVVYTGLPAYLQNLEDEIMIYGTFLNGQDIYSSALEPRGIIVMGNEGNGISEQVSACVNKRLFIPPYPAEATVIDSLNVGVATAIVCSEFRRQNRLSCPATPNL